MEVSTELKNEIKGLLQARYDVRKEQVLKLLAKNKDKALKQILKVMNRVNVLNDRRTIVDKEIQRLSEMLQKRRTPRGYTIHHRYAGEFEIELNPEQVIFDKEDMYNKLVVKLQYASKKEFESLMKEVKDTIQFEL